MKKKLSLVAAATFISCFMFSCNSTDNNSFIVDPLVQANASKDQIDSKISLDSPAFSSQGTEMSGFAIMNDGKIVKYQTTKNGSSISAITITYKSKWVQIESRATNSTDADTILKLARQGGYVKEFNELNSRYSALGLI